MDIPRARLSSYGSLGEHPCNSHVDHLPTLCEGQVYDESTALVDWYSGEFYETTDLTSYTDMQASLMIPSLIMTSQQQSTVVRNQLTQSTPSIYCSLVERLPEDRKTSLFMTICNILPALQGPGLFSMPFAIMVGGLSVIPTFLALCLLADVSGMLLVECLYAISPRSNRRKRVRMDYVEVAIAVWGTKGGHFINCIVVLYMFLTNMCKVVMLGRSFYHIVGGYLPFSYNITTILLALILVPTTFVKRLSVLAYFSMIGVVAIIGSIVAALAILLQHTDVWSSHVHQIPVFEFDGFPLAIGILLFSLLLNSILPQIEGSMIQPQKIGTALHVSFTLSTALKIGFGLIGALAFGTDVKQIMALNISELNYIAGTLINIAICVYVFTNFPLNLTIVTDAFDKLFLGEHELSKTRIVLWQIFTRPLLVYIHVGIGLFVPYYGIISGLSGAVIGICLVFWFPFWFHLKLKRHELSTCRKLLQIACMLLGTAFSVLAVYSSLNALVKEVANGS